MFQEIKELIKKGLEISILNNEKESKNVFFELLSKIEQAEQKEMLQKNQKLEEKRESSQENKNMRTYEKLDEDLKREMCMVASVMPPISQATFKRVF